jgi:hypothetical protein
VETHQKIALSFVTKKPISGKPGQVISEPDKLGLEQITFLATEDSSVIWEIVGL